MKATFTPGPWFVGEVRNDADGDERQIDTGPGGAVICSVWPMGVDFDEPATAPEREANARLIAKAPEMCAMLANFTASLDALVNGEWDEADDGDKERHIRELADEGRAMLAEIDQ